MFGEYSFWKNRMRAFLCSINESVWNVVLLGYTEPTMIEGEGENARTIPKPRKDWDDKELALATLNSKGLNAIFNALSKRDVLLVQTCTQSKEAWDKLETFYEGTKKHKIVKLQRLATRFELIKMEESETFTGFYSELTEIVNDCHALGEPISDTKIVRKILRSLPPRFKGKVDAIEESQDIDNIILDELIGNLQTYEDGFDAPKDAPNTAFNTIAKGKDSSEGDDVTTSTSNVSLLTKRFEKYLKYKAEKIDRKLGTKGCDSSSEEVECFICHGFGHVARDCPNKKPMKQKHDTKLVFDNSSSDSDSQPSDNENDSGIKCLMAPVTEYKCLSPRDIVMNSESSDDEYSDDSEVSFPKILEQNRDLIDKNYKL